jgi:hypothetical protein
LKGKFGSLHWEWEENGEKEDEGKEMRGEGK